MSACIRWRRRSSAWRRMTRRCRSRRSWRRRLRHPSSVSYRWRDPSAHNGRSHMPQEVRMPALGQTSDQLRILSWLKREGERVTMGEPLLEVETDKAALTVEAAFAGTLAKIEHQAGETVEAGTV